MATPGQLVQAMASVLGLPAATVTQFDRQLAEAGLRSKSGRGTSAARVTAEDAANLLIAIMAAPISGPAIKEAVGTCTTYGSLPTRLRDQTGFRRFGLRNLAELSAEHRLQQALSCLIDSASKGELLKLPSLRRLKNPSRFSVDRQFAIRLGGPYPWAEIIAVDSFANERSAARARLVYNQDTHSEGDLNQERWISFATIRVLGSLLAGSPSTPPSENLDDA